MSVPSTDPRFYFLVRRLASLVLTVLTRWRVYGLENVPERGPYIVVVNHLNMFDTPLIMAALPAQLLVFAAHTHRHDFFVGELMNQAGAIWVQRGEVDRHALGIALEALKAGRVLGMAPEGTRSKTGALQPGKVGAAYLATRANVPLLPVAVTGTELVWPALGRLQRAVLTATIGPPFRLPAAGRVDMAELKVYTDQIMRTLAAMLPEPYRGVYR